jgi:predicted dehydrogenase
VSAPVRWGVLSTARITAAFAAAAAASERAELVAVASRDLGRGEAWAAEHGGVRAHAGYDALLADPEVEAVYIAVPNALHVPWSIRALEAGRHVLCEKPLSARGADAEAAVAAAGRAGRVLCEGFMYRHHPQILELERLVAGGAVGALRHVRAVFSFPHPDLSADPRGRPELDGGALLDVGCYGVHAARLLAGEPSGLGAQRVLGGGGVDVRLSAHLRFGGGVTAQLDCALDLPPRAGLEVVGQEGVLTLGDPWHGWHPGITLRREGREERLASSSGEAHLLQLEHVCGAIRGETTPRVAGADVIGQAHALEAVAAAAAAADAPPLSAP